MADADVGKYEMNMGQDEVFVEIYEPTSGTDFCAFGSTKRTKISINTR